MEKSLDAALPSKSQIWIKGGRKAIRVDRSSHRSLKKELQKVLDQGTWKWPKRRVFFFTDLHADTDAFIDSLIASGSVTRTGPEDDAWKLTKAGRRGLFVIGAGGARSAWRLGRLLNLSPHGRPAKRGPHNAKRPS